MQQHRVIRAHDPELQPSIRALTQRQTRFGLRTKILPRQPLLAAARRSLAQTINRVIGAIDGKYLHQSAHVAANCKTGRNRAAQIGPGGPVGAAIWSMLPAVNQRVVAGMDSKK